MTERVFRFPLQITDRQAVHMPLGARILSVNRSRVQPNLEIDMWALCDDDPNLQSAPTDVFIHGTGHPVDEYYSSHFIGTVVTPSGLVWHVFAR